MFILEKVFVLPMCSSLVAQGEMFAGRELSLWHWERPEERITCKSIFDIKAGWQVILNDGTYIRTSEIDSIVDTSLDPDWVIFKTQTSVYRIREVDHA